MDEETRLRELVAEFEERLTDTVSSADRLHELADQQKTICDQLSAMLWWKDTRNNFIRVNRAAAHAMGVEAAAAEGRNAAEFFPDEAAQYLRDDLEVIDSGRAKVGIVEKMQVAGGQKIWVQTDKIPFRNASGAVVGVLVFSKDISAFREAEEHYRAAIEQSNDGMAIVRDGRYLLVNQRLVEMFGYETPEEIVGLTHRTTVHPDDLATVSSRQRERQAGRSAPSRYTYRAIKKDGTVIHLETSAARITYRGEPATLGFLRDITERRVAEEALKQSEEKYRTLVETMAEGVWVVDANHVTTLANTRMGEMLGYSAAELVGRSIFDFMDEASRRLAEGHLRGAARLVQEKQDFRFRHKDGRDVWAIVSTTPLVDPQGNYAGVVGAVTDITQRKAAEEERQQLYTAIEGAAEGFTISRADRVITYVNPAFCRISGFQREELIGQKTSIFQKGPDEHLADSIYQMVREGKAWSGRIRRLTKQGVPFDAEVRVTPVKDDQGRVISRVGTLRDITEQLKLEEQLRQALKMEAMGTLAGGIAHDFNNILAIIIGNAEIALDDLTGHEGPRRNVEQIVSASERARDLVKQILTFSRKAEGQQKPMALIPLVEETFGLLRASLPSTIQMSMEVKTKEDWVFADSTRIQQVLLNLAANAAYAMREKGGRLTFEVSGLTVRADALPQAGMHPGSYIALKVKDTGTGMTEEVQRRIFEPYFTTKEPGQGTGMGLAVVHGIAKQHGGTVVVESKIGVGWTFTIFLPRAVAGRTEDTPAKKKQLPRGKERILFVDDEQSLADSTRIMLERLGYEVTATCDSAEALNIFMRDPHHFNLVITDQTMPGLTGLALARRMMKVRKEIPIILCTGFSENVSRDVAKASGIREFIMKPIARREMAEAIRRVLQSRPANPA